MINTVNKIVELTTKRDQILKQLFADRKYLYWENEKYQEVQNEINRLSKIVH